jgi:hypothetical protein
MGMDPTRREFIGTGALVGGCVALCPALGRNADAEEERPAPSYVFDERVSYCCGDCTKEKCQWLGGDMEFKRKKAAELSAKLGREIKPEQITCSRCRVADGKAFESIKRCRIRQCVIEKKLLSCAHCPELKGCERANPLTRERALALQRVVLGEAR